MRVLVVDDDVDTTESFRLLLGVWGHVIAVANDGQAALDLAEAFRPDVAMLDVVMPGMGGYELARRLRELPGLSGVRLLALTGWEGHCEPGVEFDVRLVKTVGPGELKRLLDALAVGRG